MSFPTNYNRIYTPSHTPVCTLKTVLMKGCAVRHQRTLEGNNNHSRRDGPSWLWYSWPWLLVMSASLCTKGVWVCVCVCVYCTDGLCACGVFFFKFLRKHFKLGKYNIVYTHIIHLQSVETLAVFTRVAGNGVYLLCKWNGRMTGGGGQR